jgi:hypothetical protein
VEAETLMREDYRPCTDRAAQEVLEEEARMAIVLTANRTRRPHHHRRRLSLILQTLRQTKALMRGDCRLCIDRAAPEEALEGEGRIPIAATAQPQSHLSHLSLIIP